MAAAPTVGYFAPMTDAPAADWADTTEQQLLGAAIRLAPKLGWNQGLVDAAAAEIGLGKADASLLLPSGPRDLAALLSRRHDQEAMRALASTDAATLKIRERIRRGVQARVEA